MKHIVGRNGKPICGTRIRGPVDASFVMQTIPLVLMKQEIRERVLQETDCKRCRRDPYRD